MDTASPIKSMMLSELRVFELKKELEKRGLDKSGIKLALVERLEAALRDEGSDPETYKFIVNSYNKSSGDLLSPFSSDSIAAMHEQSTEFAECVNMEGEQAGGVGMKLDECLTSELMIEADEVKDENGGENFKSEQADVNNKEIIGVNTCMMDSERMEAINNGIDDGDKSPEELMGEAMEDTVTEVMMDVKESADSKVDEDDEMLKSIKDDFPAITPTNEEMNFEENDESCITIHDDQPEEEMVGTQPVGKSGSKLLIAGDDGAPKISSKGASAETVESTPAKEDAVEKNVQQVASTLKKTDNSLWIKGISPNTKAADLKALFAKYGRVLTAKIFTKRHQPSSSCFGFVTMLDPTAADLCIRKLHKSTVKGRLISVERADRCSIPTIKTLPKKSGATASELKDGKSSATDEKKDSKSGVKSGDKLKKEPSSSDKSKNIADENSTSLEGDKQRSEKADPISKRSPVKAPLSQSSSTHSPFSTHHQSTFSRKRTVLSRPPVFRRGRRIDRPDRLSTMRRSLPTRRPAYLSSFARRSAFSGRIFSGRFSRGGSSRLLSRREVTTSRIDSSSSWEKREMIEMLRKKEEEHRLKEQELRLQRERERLKFERERFERERLELQQLRQIAALTTPMQTILPTSGVASSRRSHENYTEIDSSSRRDNYPRSGERSSSNRNTSSSHVGSDRHESRSSSRHVSGSNSSRADTDRSRERERSRHGTREVRDYGSVSSNRETDSRYVRDPHTYSRAGYSHIPSSYARETYRSDTTYSGHRTNDPGYGSRDFGAFTSPSSYSREIVPSSYSKDAGYSATSRSVTAGSGSGGASWPVAGSSSAFVGSSSSRDYDSSGGWMSSMTSSQNRGAHSMGGGNWPSSRDDHWSGSANVSQDTHAHSSTYDKYDKSYKYESYDKYGRRY